jgi:hypothetical protein
VALLGPPVDIAPERLFRLLLQRPRPRWPLSFRAAAAPHIALHAVALRGAELQGLIDEATHLKAPEARTAHLGLEVMARTLWTAEGPAFRSADEAGAFLEGDAALLRGELAAALAIIGPTFARSDTRAWARILRKGAEHRSNIDEALLAASAVDLGVFGGFVQRPDRYFGVALAEITDGQLMAYRAARALLSDLQK